jgi:hypothetical protein
MVYTLFLRGLQLLARAKVRRVVFGFRRKIIMHTLSHAANNARTDLSPDFLRGPRSELYLFSALPQQFVQVSSLPSSGERGAILPMHGTANLISFDAKSHSNSNARRCSPLGGQCTQFDAKMGKFYHRRYLKKGQDSRLSLFKQSTGLSRSTTGLSAVHTRGAALGYSHSTAAKSIGG